ncbi:MAG: aminoglycoside phosphotransferase family protein [Chloroflexota bacterium]|nr:aminoglycoside phosphotransferase family protein [Chloroflexota bacterium]
MHAYESRLRPLLAYLAHTAPTTPTTWQAWSVTPVAGGANNRLYRTTDTHVDLAIKFTIRDQRDRAGREYAALSALAQVGSAIAPQPILLDQTCYDLPVIVQTWLEGTLLALPAQDDEWLSLLHHLVTIHAVSQKATTISLMPAVLNAASVQACRTLVAEQLDHLPSPHQSPALRTLVQHLEKSLPRDWTPPALRLCRVDPNLSNFICRPAGIASIDWENSGWGDPAFEIADMMTHPAYRTIPCSRWTWVIENYCAMVNDATVATRITVYYKTMLVWWAVRFARMLYEVPQGLDQRLVPRPQNWEQDIRAKYDEYLTRAESQMCKRSGGCLFRGEI